VNLQDARCNNKDNCFSLFSTVTEHTDSVTRNRYKPERRANSCREV